jgi:flavin-binding protein dodecin
MESIMANVLKVLEVLSESPESWEDAAKRAVAKTAGSVHNIRSIYIKEMEAQVDNG